MMDRWDERVGFLCRSRVILTWRAGERNPALYVLSANSLCDRVLRGTLHPVHDHSSGPAASARAQHQLWVERSAIAAARRRRGRFTVVRRSASCR